MCAKLTTLAHFSVSATMILPKSAGDPTTSWLPSSAKRVLILGSAKAALTALFRMATTLSGVPRGPTMR